MYGLAQSAQSGACRASMRANLILLMANLSTPLSRRHAADHGALHATRGSRRRTLKRVTGARSKRELVTQRVDRIVCGPAAAETETEPNESVRFLAPFDPLVWDRKRFLRIYGLGLPVRGVHARPTIKMGYYARRCCGAIRCGMGQMRASRPPPHRETRFAARARALKNAFKRKFGERRNALRHS